MAKWSIQLSDYDIHYEPRTTIKSQALADFVSNFTPGLQSFADEEVSTVLDDGSTRTWTLYTDGASSVRGIGLGIMLMSLEKDEIVQAVNSDFRATNNESEYEAVLFCIMVARELNTQI